MLVADSELRSAIAVRAVRRDLLRLKWLSAATRFEFALRRHRRALRLAYKYGYNPAEPRDDLGRWTDTGGSPTRIHLAGDVPTGDPPEIPKEKPPTSKERTDLKKAVARWLDQVSGTIRTLEAAAEMTEWFLTYSPEIQSYRDPPKSLEELQGAVSTPAPGYDIHHIVERSQGAYFSNDLINGPDNLVLVPRLKHQEINGWYQRISPEFGGQAPRDYLNGRSWEVQRAMGLEALRKFGVLKP